MMIWKKMCATDPWPQKSSTWLGLGFANVPIRPTPGWLFNEIIRDVRDLRVAPIWSCRIRHLPTRSGTTPRTDGERQCTVDTSHIVTYSRSPVQVFFLLCVYKYFDIRFQRKQIQSWNVWFTFDKSSQFRVPGCASHKWYWVCDSLCRCSPADAVFSLPELALEDTPDVAEYLMQCVCSDQLNIQLKGVREPRTIEHMCNIVPPKGIKRLCGSTGSMFVACSCSPCAG